MLRRFFSFENSIPMWLGGVCLFVGFCLAIRLTWLNRGSATIALAAAGLIGTGIVFALNVWFELKPPKAPVEIIGAEFILDHSKSNLSDFGYSTNQGFRKFVEREAMQKLVDLNPKALVKPGASRDDVGAFDGDLVFLSLISFLAWKQSDWQLVETKIKGHSWAITKFARASTESDSTKITEDDFKTRLRGAGNRFADSLTFRGYSDVLLPPDTQLGLDKYSMAIQNPFCRISFKAEPSGSLQFIDPKTGRASELVNGVPRFETHLVGLRVETTYFALRARHPEHDKYEEWRKRLLADLREWFEGSPSNGL